MENVYLLVTDLHWRDRNISSRYDYKKETDHVYDKILDVIFKYSSGGSNVYLIFLGDIYHDSYKNLFDAVGSNNRIISLRNVVSGIYSVVGNHEFTYYKDNPFWTLFTEIRSEKVKRLLSKVWQPVGTMDAVNVVDDLEDGEVRFIFNHYGCGVTSPIIGDKINFGLFHQDLYARQIVDEMKLLHGQEVFEHKPVYFDRSAVLRGYDYAYFGHMHMFYGKWDYVCETTGYETRLEYLSTLGRTNHREVNNNFLERNIPAVVVKDGKLSRIDDNKFELMRREDCVKEDLIEKQIKERDIKKEREYFASYQPIVDDPIENMKAGLVGKAAYVALIEELLSEGKPRFEKDLLEELEEVRRL